MEKRKEKCPAKNYRILSLMCCASLGVRQEIRPKGVGCFADE
jgi:hypothetical protein